MSRDDLNLDARLRDANHALLASVAASVDRDTVLDRVRRRAAETGAHRDAAVTAAGGMTTGPATPSAGVFFTSRRDGVESEPARGRLWLHPHDSPPPVALAAAARRRIRSRRIVGATLALVIAIGSAIGVAARLGDTKDSGAQLTPASAARSVRVTAGAPIEIPWPDFGGIAVAADGTLWLGLPRTATSPSGLYRASPGDRRPTLVAALPSVSLEVAVTARYVWVRPYKSVQPQQTLYQYEARTGRLIASYPVVLSSGPVAAQGDDVWMVSGSYSRQSVVLISGAERRVLRSVEIATPLSSGLTHPTAAGDSVFVEATGRVVRVDRDGRKTAVRPQVPPDGRIQPLASSGRTVLIGFRSNHHDVRDSPNDLREPPTSFDQIVAVDAYTLAVTGRVGGSTVDRITGGAHVVGLAPHRILIWDVPGLTPRAVVGSVDSGILLHTVVTARAGGPGAPAWLVADSGGPTTARPLTFVPAR